MAKLIEQITAVDNDISKLRATLPALIKREQDWRSAHNLLYCDHRLKSKREACQKDKAFKLGKANQAASSIRSTKSQIEALEKTKKSLQNTLDAQNVASVNLSKTGQSLEAIIIEAEGKNEALEIEAIAKAEVTKSEHKSDEKNNNILIVLIVVVVLLGVGFGVVKLKKLNQNG
ncbi:MAG: hypothetical protein MK066_14675 [Crocinitomicaceae bacterium]|nr:hypothetical protein [Crocinitomicaceae bacterium]